MDTGADDKKLSGGPGKHGTKRKAEPDADEPNKHSERKRGNIYACEQSLFFERGLSPNRDKTQYRVIYGPSTMNLHGMMLLGSHDKPGSERRVMTSEFVPNAHTQGVIAVAQTGLLAVLNAFTPARLPVGIHRIIEDYCAAPDTVDIFLHVGDDLAMLYIVDVSGLTDQEQLHIRATTRCIMCTYFFPGCHSSARSCVLVDYASSGYVEDSKSKSYLPS